MQIMEEDEPLSSSEAPQAPALDTEEGRKACRYQYRDQKHPSDRHPVCPPLERRRARARVGRLRVACIGVCAVSVRAG